MDWVLDPTAGAGTTLVEALRHQRNVVGVELQFGEVICKNVSINNPAGQVVHVIDGDARDLNVLLERSVPGQKFKLVVNNPPYSADQSQKYYGKEEYRRRKGKGTHYKYDPSVKRNLAFLKESDEYWNTMEQIYRECLRRLQPGGFLAIGVKDMVRNFKYYKLHFHFAEILADLGMYFVGVVLLPHYPPTMFMSTYGKRTGITPPMYQTIVVFQKKRTRRIR